MPNIMNFLANDLHINPVLKAYIKKYDPTFTKDSLHNIFIDTPEGDMATYRLDIAATGRSGSYNIRDGYMQALSQCLQTGARPKKIKILSIINHGQAHWTSSVCEITLADGFLDKLQEKMKTCFNLWEAFESGLSPEDWLYYSREENFKLVGMSKAEIRHYDSLYGNAIEGPYYDQYCQTLYSLFAQNDGLIKIKPTQCVGQLGNTCGDHSVWNSFTDGILGLALDSPLIEQPDSNSLRAYTEQLTNAASDGNHLLSEQIDRKIDRNILLSQEHCEKHEYEDAAPAPFLQYDNLSPQLKEILSIETKEIRKKTTINNLSPEMYWRWIDIDELQKILARKYCERAVNEILNTNYNDLPHDVIRFFSAQTKEERRHIHITNPDTALYLASLSPDEKIECITHYRSLYLQREFDALSDDLSQFIIHNIIGDKRAASGYWNLANFHERKKILEEYDNKFTGKKRPD